MKGFLKVGLALGAVAAGTAWALRRYAPETYAELRGKAADIVKKLVPLKMELTMVAGDTAEDSAGEDSADTVAVDPEVDAAFTVETADNADADGDTDTAEEWPDLSQMPDAPDQPAD